MARPHNMPGYRPDIDGMRAMAVLAVVIFHAVPSWLEGGFVGVDVFFVISGFLISSILARDLKEGSFSFVEFYRRRIKRIFPSLLCILIFCFGVGWFCLTPTEFMQLGKHIAGGAGFISNILLWGEAGYFDRAAETKPLLHLWSLAIEEQFYILWPAILWIAAKRKANLPLVAMTVAFLSFCLGSLTVFETPSTAFYLLHTRMWELLAGGILALTQFRVADTFRKIPPIIINNSCSAIGLTLLVGSAVFLSKSVQFPGPLTLLPTIGAVLLIAAGPNAWINRTVLSHRILVGIGLISFPLYLWHWPLLFFVRILNQEIVHQAAVGIAVGASFMLAWLTYAFIELPIRFASHQRRGVTAALCLAMCLAAVVGWDTFSREGLAYRFPPEIRMVTQPINFKWDENVRSEKCHLQAPYSFSHDSTCFETQRPLVAVWGDSSAASLYPGLQKLQNSRDFGIIQVTQSGCGPIFNLERLLVRPNCNEVNRHVFTELISRQPDVLVLHAAWIHDHYPLSLEGLRQKFSETLVEIRAKLPSTRLIVIGPVPRWQDSPQQTGYRYWQVHRTAIPPALLPAIELTAVDMVLRDVAKNYKLLYISPNDLLCKDGNCVARVGNQLEDFISTDFLHLTKAGSEFFVHKIQSQILNGSTTSH